VPLPGFSVSVLRQQTFAQRNQPVTMSGRVTGFGFGFPAFVRVSLEGPAHNPEVQTFDTFASPFTGDYAIPVLAAKDGEYVVYAQAFPPLGIPLPGAPEPLFLGPALAESPRPPLVIGRPVNGQLEMELEPGRVERVAPPSVEVITPITIGAPVIRIGAPAPPRAALPPWSPPPPAAPPPAAPPPVAPPPAAPPPAAPPPAAPPPPPTEAIPLPEEPVLPEVTGLSSTFTPAEVTIGEVAAGTLSWLPQGTQDFTFGVRVDLVTEQGWAVRNILQATPRATMGARQDTLLAVDTTGLSEGWYGLEVTFTDLATGAEILKRTLVGVLLLVPPPLPPELPEGLSLGDLTVATPTVTPNTVEPGGNITIQVPFTNMGPVAVPVSIDSFLMDSGGRVALMVPRDIFTPQLEMGVTRTSTLTIPTDMPGGSYGLLIMAVDANTGVLLIQQTFPSMLTVVIPEVAPPPPPPPPPPAEEVVELEPPAPTASIDSLSVQGSVDLGGPLWVRVAWRSSVPAYVAADLMEPPDFTGYKSAASSEMRAAGSYSDELRIPVDPGNAEGNNRLRVSVASEAGVILDRRTTMVAVVSPEF